jgi:hypothetical protein
MNIPQAYVYPLFSHQIDAKPPQSNWQLVSRYGLALVLSSQ